MNAADVFDAAAIRGEEFKGAKAFSVAKKKILDVLVDSIAHFEYGGQGNPQIEIARDLELVDYATKLLNSSFQHAHEAENLEELHRLHTIALDLKTDPVYNYEPPQDVLSYEEVISEMYLHNQLLLGLDNMRKGIKRESLDRIMLARNLAAEFKEMEPVTRRGGFLKSKALVASNILENDLSSALHLQEGLVRGVREGNLCSSTVELLTEHSVLVTLHLAVGNTMDARQHALRMGALRTDNPREDRFLNTHFIHNTFSLAEKTLNMDILEQGLERFKDHSHLLAPAVQAIHLRLAAVVTFYNAAFKKSLRLLKKLEGMKSKEWDSFKWFVRLVELTALLEMDDLDQFDYSLGRAKRAVDEEDGEYPMAVLQFLEKYGKRMPNQFSELDYHACLDKLDQLAENPIANKQMLFFDFRVWLKSKLNQMPMLEVVQLDESARWRLVSGMMY